MAVQDYKINYKSDFVLNINGDAGWAIQFCIKFWTGMPSQAYFVGFDGVKYVNCRVGDTPTQLLVMFDDHHLPIGPLKMQIAYHTTIEEFPGSVFDEVTNARDVIVTIDGTDYQVMLDFTGEDAPELEFDLPAYANEAERIQNEADRIAAELHREQATAAAVQGAENVNAQLNGTTLTVTNRLGVSTSVNTKGEQGVPGPVGPEGPQGETGISIVSFLPKSETATTLIYTVTFSNGHTQEVSIPKGAKGDTGATGPTGPQGPQGQTGVSITGFVETGETETATLYTITFSNSTTQQVAIPKGEKGDQGPVGPVGPQGPMGDVAVITPEQQAAFTMYSETGQNTDGPMTQKAVTDALVASTISYNNSQSGLAAENVQEAIDRLADNSDTVMNALGMTEVVDVCTMTSDRAISTYTYPIHAGDKFIVKPNIGSRVSYVSMTTRSNDTTVERVLTNATTNDEVVFTALEDADEFGFYSSRGSSSVSVKQIKETGIVKRVFESDMQLVEGVWCDKQNGVFVSHTGSQLGFLPLSGYDYVRIEGIKNSAIAFVSSNATSGEIPYSTKYPEFIAIDANTETYPIPQDAAYLIVPMTYQGTYYYTPKSIELTIGEPISYRLDELENHENEVFNQVRVIEGTPLLRFTPKVNTTTWQYYALFKSYIVKVPTGTKKVKVETWNGGSIVYLQDNYTMPSGTSDVAINGICDNTSAVQIDAHSIYINEIPSDCAYIGVTAYYTSGGQIKDAMPLFMGFSSGSKVSVNEDIYSLRHDVLTNPLSCYVLGDGHAAVSNRTISKSTIYWPVITRTRHDGALGKYYMYFSEDHVTDSPIYMAYSDNIMDWTYYGVVATSMNQLGAYGDIETPAIIWDDMNERYLLYYHSSTIDKAGTGYRQISYISESEDGINWTYLKPFTTINKNKFCGDFHNGYIRIDKIGNLLFAHGLIGGGDASLSTRYYSYDGVNWLINPNQTGVVNSMCKPVTQGETSDLREIVLQTGSYLNINGHNYITYTGGTNGSGTSSRVLNLFLQEVLDDWFTPAGKALRLTTEELNLRSCNTFVDDNGDVYYLVVNSITGSTSSQNYMVVLISKLTRI